MSLCPLDTTPADVTDILARLKSLSSAEEFFALLAVRYHPEVLATARLHILKRMGQYLAEEDFDGMPDRVIAARCRSHLQRAYEDFAASSPIRERVFKVLKDRDPARPVKPGRAFVRFEEILRPLPQDPVTPEA